LDYELSEDEEFNLVLSSDDDHEEEKDSSY
jgi:hypothetical protein